VSEKLKRKIQVQDLGRYYWLVGMSWAAGRPTPWAGNHGIRGIPWGLVG
jgi:hypothetical protein